MKGVVSNFRRARHHVYHNQLIIHPEGVETREKAIALVGKKVVWKSPAGKEIKGEIRAAHGGKGAVRVLFETGMPGQALGKKINIL